MAGKEEDFYDFCAICNESQSHVSNLSNEPLLVCTISKCGHKFHSKCVLRELHNKRQFACPKCKTMVTNDKLSKKSLEEAEVERDLSIRRKLKDVFNKTVNDFSNAYDHKNYEEQLEDLIYNLANSIDVENTMEFIKQYKQDNAKLITLNQYRKSEELKKELTAINNEQEQQALKQQEFQASLKIEQAQRKEQKRHINDIMLGESNQNIPLARPVGAFAGPAGGVSIPTGTNAAQAFFEQRPEPKPLTEGGGFAKRAVSNSKDLRDMYRAGGYDHANYQRRNWDEILSQLARI